MKWCIGLFTNLNTPTWLVFWTNEFSVIPAYQRKFTHTKGHSSRIGWWMNSFSLSEWKSHTPPTVILNLMEWWSVTTGGTVAHSEHCRWPDDTLLPLFIRAYKSTALLTMGKAAKWSIISIHRDSTQPMSTWWRCSSIWRKSMLPS